MNVVLSRLTLLLMIVGLYSCGSTKEVILLQQNAPQPSKDVEAARTIPMQEKEYRIRANDRLMLNIFSLTDEKSNFLKEPQIEKMVDTKGQIELPVIGSITLSGLSIKQAEDTIKRVASDYLRNPSVTIRLMNFQITVIGEVTKQGVVLVPEPHINLLEAIGQAGGFTENANRQTVRIVRNENKSAKIYPVNMLDQNSLSSKNFFLEPNDVILVNPKKVLSNRENRLSTISLALGLMSSVTFIVYQLTR
jgi:polysaccharide export outer membrane protein